MPETTTPMLPCHALAPVLDFYTALGFDVTYRQASPNPYAVVERGDVALHLYGIKNYDPAASYSTCLIGTDDVDGLHAAFRAGLKAALGRIPTTGLPRIGPLRDTSYGVRQFLVTDPAGNCLRIGQPTSDDPSHRPAPREPYARALHQAALFAHGKEDQTAAARVIDRALARTADRPTPVQLLRLLVLRADVAARLGDDAGATAALDRATSVTLDLTPEEQASVTDDLARLAELRDQP
ncbi:bleomycin resistance protein [Streptomyces avicenniae]|uniref:bleomycin resistance protein n=1 Tax=Streptomyces avicenniae TaxID=500153 RepID=UPI000699742F|nr:VOC family protein [Streptomyces avicenniae]